MYWRLLWESYGSYCRIAHQMFLFRLHSRILHLLFHLIESCLYLGIPQAAGSRHIIDRCYEDLNDHFAATAHPWKIWYFFMAHSDPAPLLNSTGLYIHSKGPIRHSILNQKSHLHSKSSVGLPIPQNEYGRLAYTQRGSLLLEFSQLLRTSGIQCYVARSLWTCLSTWLLLTRIYDIS